MRNLLVALGLAALSVGCTFMARSPEDYKSATRAAVETKNADVKACYDTALKADANLSGSVIVHFTVEQETGTIKGASVLPESTAPEALSTCIVNALGGLQLDPPDAREGDATFTWEFSKG